MSGETNILPRVSCVVAVYNGAAYLREAVDSLLAQTYPDVEVVVVDDGSTDGTAGVIASYGDRVRAVHQANRGVSAARNRGVGISSGELLCFLDADDWLDPRKIAAQAAAFVADARLDLCDCHTAYFWSPEIPADVLERDPRYGQSFWRKLLPSHISTWLFRRALWDRVGGFSDKLRYAEDVDWFSRARDLPMKQLTLPDALTHRRLHLTNVTARCRSEQAAALARTLMAHVVRRRAAIGGAS